MITTLALILAGFLLIIAIIDLKVRAIPSIFLTGMIFVVMALNQDHLYFGALAFVMAYLLYEADFWRGVADIKVFTIIGFMIPSLYTLFIAIILVGLYGIFWKALIKWKTKQNEEAFLPVLFFTYVTLMILGGIR